MPTETIKSKNQPANGRSRLPTDPRFIILGAHTNWLGLLRKSHSLRCHNVGGILKALPKATGGSLWISPDAASTDMLLRAMRDSFAHGRGEPRGNVGSLLFLETPRTKTLPFLRHWFRRLIGESASFKLLSREQLLEVLAAPDEQRQDVFLGGVVDREIGLLSLIRGNLERVTVPLSIFRRSGTSRPNFQKFELADYGHTVRFGEYEAAADFILFDAAPDYRRRLNARRLAEERGFGASLRRLRRQRGLSRNDFPGLAAKTIGRLERRDVAKPQGRTLTIIAKTLGVAPDEIESY